MGLILIVEYNNKVERKKERIAFYCEGRDEHKALIVAKSYGVLFAQFMGYNETDAQTIVRDNLNGYAPLHEYDRNLFTEYWNKKKIDYWYFYRRLYDPYHSRYRRSATAQLMRFV